jgi:hypothetical protein
MRRVLVVLITLATVVVAADRRCWFIAAPNLSSDGTSIETQLSLSQRVSSFLDASNATSVSLAVFPVPVDSLSASGTKDVWTESLNRYNVRWGDQYDRNDMGYKSGIEAISKAWALFVQYSSALQCTAFPTNTPSISIVFIPFGQVPGVTTSESINAQQSTSVPSFLVICALMTVVLLN